MISGTDLRLILEATLAAANIDYARIVDEFGQVQACEQRAAGQSFDLSDHVRGVILAQLSANRPWGPIANNLEKISRIFFDYDPEAIKAEDASVFISGILALGCGNRSIKAQMEALNGNINTLERIQREYGSVDAFVVHDEPHAVAKALSSPGSYKLVQIGYPLALEYLRNVGMPAIKPDQHVRRALGNERLGFIDHYPTEVEAYDVLMELSRSAGCNPTYLDNLLWIFCAQDYAAICGADPECNRCGFRSKCHYGEQRGTSGQTVLQFTS